MDKFEELFYPLYIPLDEDQILALNAKRKGPSSLKTVITGLHKQCFGIICIDDTDNILYRLFYVTRQSRLEGDMIELTIRNPNRNQILFYFSQFLEHNYKSLNVIDVFNTFQTHTRTLLEGLDILTVSPEELQLLDNTNCMIMTNEFKDVVSLPLINKTDFYQSFMGSTRLSGKCQSEMMIYLMLNSRTNLVKIGKSKNPIHREKTLQGQEPEVILIACWQAPDAIEKKLHQEFAGKRKRGEWFKLSLVDLNKIKIIMRTYEKREFQ